MQWNVLLTRKKEEGGREREGEMREFPLCDIEKLQGILFSSKEKK